MSQLFYLSAEQLERIKPFFPLSHGIPRVDDLKVISGIIYIIKHGLQWKDAPREYGRLNSKLHAVCDGHGRPLAMTLTEGQVSGYKGAALLM